MKRVQWSDHQVLLRSKSNYGVIFVRKCKSYPKRASSDNNGTKLLKYVHFFVFGIVDIAVLQ